MRSTDDTAQATPPRGELPPGQRELDWFPRFGRDLTGPPPAVPQHPTLQITGAGSDFEVDLAELAELPHCEIVADFHCVAGWTVRHRRWGGVRFAEFYRRFVRPRLSDDIVVSHVRFRGADGAAETAELRDVLGDDVLLADHLDGAQLDGDHGAALRLISPAQYGYLNVKHLIGFDFLTGPPPPPPGLANRIISSHPRGRVWQEERHPHVPGRIVRPVYRLIKIGLLQMIKKQTGRSASAGRTGG